MTGRSRRSSARVAALVTVAVVSGGCAPLVDGTVVGGSPSWPGARLERGVLRAEDFPPGVRYDRAEADPGRADGAGGPPPMLSKPTGCTDGLTRVIAGSAERGPGSAIEYVVGYDGARISMTVLSWRLDIDALAVEAQRCARFEAFFDSSSPGIPMTTSRLTTTSADTLAYQQTMRLGSAESSVYFWFGNVGSSALFGIAFPTPNPDIEVKAELPQTFMEIAARQAARLGTG
ncbi:MAG: hypothetical protein K0R01_1744 [Mycobacterium sp.]|nr:hypothetical protein [Mycobacterium sp.]